MNDGAWVKGIGLVILGYVAAGLVFGVVSLLSANESLSFLMSAVFAGVLGFGLTQLLWVVPLAIWKRGEKKTLWGILATAGVGFLLNAACWGIVGSSLNNMH